MWDQISQSLSQYYDDTSFINMDIKPGNIIISKHVSSGEYNYSLIDFGNAYTTTTNLTGCATSCGYASFHETYDCCIDKNCNPKPIDDIHALLISIIEYGYKYINRMLKTFHVYNCFLISSACNYTSEQGIVNTHPMADLESFTAW